MRRPSGCAPGGAKSWVQTVAPDSRQKVEAMLRDAQAAVNADVGRWRQVNHPAEDGDELPLLYSAVRLGDGAPRGKGRIVAFARDLRATVALQRRLIDTQQAMERDYWRSREAETRYRHLLETSSEAVLIVDGSTQKVLEANPAARALCASTRAKLVGAALPMLFETAHGERLQDLLAAARSVGKKDAVRVRLLDGSTEVAVSASVFRQEDAVLVLVRLTPGAARRLARARGLAAAAAPCPSPARAGKPRWRPLCRTHPTAWCSATKPAVCSAPTAPSSPWPN